MVSTNFNLYVYQINLPPAVPEVVDIYVEAGDEMIFHFNVTDPENDPIEIRYHDRLPYWIEIDEMNLTMTLTPLIYEIGYNELNLAFDDRYNHPCDMILKIHVTGTLFPPFPVPEVIEIMERNSLEIDLDWEYEKNGTKFFDVKGLEPFMDFTGASITIRPQDGDHGEYLLNISYGIVNGTKVSGRIVRLIVHRNLSSLWTNVTLHPKMKVYEVGDTVRSNLQWGGYFGQLDFYWIWEIEGSTYEQFHGDGSTIRLNLTGNWRMYLFVEGEEEPLQTLYFSVSEGSSEENDQISGTFILVLVFVLISLTVIVTCSIVFVWKRRSRSAINETSIQEKDPVKPDLGPGQSVGPIFQGEGYQIGPHHKGNHYTEDIESSPHDTSYLRREEGSEESSQN
jgi:hypothetical protein